MITPQHISNLKQLLAGKVHSDDASKIIYASDASVYYEKPSAIVIPESNLDLEKLIIYTNKHSLPIIPRAAGTSLAGQVVGNGIVVDISKHFTKINEINTSEKWVTVEPGVILDELNRELIKKKLFFGPETSTANRCTIGGMVGNNACGLHAVIYGTTRDHLLEVSGYLSDGSKVTFGALSKQEFIDKCKGDTLENRIYKQLNEILSNAENQREIIENFPEKELIRRNNGYALDQLLYTEPFSQTTEKINVAKLIAGSEGTLMFISEIKLNLVDAPPKNKVLVCAHFNSINNALKANIIALKHGAIAVELMDDIILNAASKNIEQTKNRFFIKGNPKAILMIEFANNSKDNIEPQVKKMISELKQNDLGFHFPIIYNEETKKAWNLRKAGLGIMANIPGDKKSVTVIEDTAVHPLVLPEYIEEFTQIMQQYNEECVYHAHAGTGEIHLRPRLNLKNESDIDKFESIAWDIAKLVKKYKGSLSGEHGDGRLRGEFTPFMLGNKVYQLLKDIKNTWDPNHIFNPGKITDTPPMRNNLRYKPGPTREIETYFDFSNKGGIVRAAESCNGSGDCRKLHSASGTMCPSYQATRDEKNTTRARANILRDFLTYSEQKNPFNNKEIYEVFDLCLSCKACKSECPSSVDVAKLKAEFLQHYYKQNGIPLRTRAIANIAKLNRIGAIVPSISNGFMKNKFTAKLFKQIIGIAKERSLPKIKTINIKKVLKQSTSNKSMGKVILFIDEFTKYNDAHLGEKAVRLLMKLNYDVTIIDHLQSGRAYLSKGLLIKAKHIANTNIKTLSKAEYKNIPILGIEPSAILTFRDEYPDLVSSELKDDAVILAKQTFLIEEFIANEIKQGVIKQAHFSTNNKEIKLHGHCQQKAIASTDPVKTILSFPVNYSVIEINSGCCGMAGSFGYEKEHYDVSMKIGELILFPEVRNTKPDVVISAPGTSCRHQINDGTGRKALHPIEIFYEALETQDYP